MTREKLIEMIEKKESTSMAVAKDAALQAIIGKPEDSEREKARSLSYYAQSRVWNEAYHMATSLDKTTPPASTEGEG
jgi:hypothetical protein